MQLKIKGSQLLVICVLLMVCVGRASFYSFVSRIKGGIYICNDIFVRVVIRVSEEHEPWGVCKIWRTVYICDKKEKKQQKKTATGPYCYCFVGLLRGITWSPVQLRVNQTFVECNKFQRGNNLFSYYRKNREFYIYICICKRSLRTLSFLNRKYFTKGATRILDRYFFFNVIFLYLQYL